MDLSQIRCRICQIDDHSNDNYVAPCLCKGSLLHVHQSCLQLQYKYTRLTQCKVCLYQMSYSFKLYPNFNCHRFSFEDLTAIKGLILAYFALREIKRCGRYQMNHLLVGLTRPILGAMITNWISLHRDAPSYITGVSLACLVRGNLLHSIKKLFSFIRHQFCVEFHNFDKHRTGPFSRLCNMSSVKRTLLRIGLKLSLTVLILIKV